MKSGRVAVAVAGLITVAGIGWAFVQGGGEVAAEPQASTAKEEANSPIVHVDELAERPSEHAGEIALRGVVARVSQDAGLFSVIDSREFESCGTVTCAEHYLPVKFSGEIPKPKTIVQLTGRTIKTEKGLLFEAERLEVVQ
jgi:hypothetical protein